MSDAARWQQLSPRARRAILLTSFGPPAVLIFVFTPVYLRYLGNPTDANLALLLAASVLLLSVGIGLSVRLIRILHREPAHPRRERMDVRKTVTLGVALVVFLAIYVSAIYAVAFGLQALDESSQAGAIATTLILLAVLVGLPIAFYLVLRRLGFRDDWTN